MKNYSPITSVNTVGKVCTVMNKRLCEWIERVGVLGKEQNDSEWTDDQKIMYLL